MINPLIIQCAQFSKDVYPGEDSAARQDAAGVLAKQDIYHPGTDTHARAYITASHLFIAVQGTKERRDWLTNIRVKKDPFFGIKAHRGFARCAIAILPEVVDIVDAHQGRRLVITGHSLGGAVAILLAIGIKADWRNYRQEPKPVDVITFGQPMVSTEAEILAAFQGNYLRVVNGSDLVPRRPNIPLAYSHAGTCIYLPNHGHWRRPLIDPSWSLRIRDRVLTGFQRLTDHDMDDYITELNTE